MADLELLIHTSDTKPYNQDRTLWTPRMIKKDKESNMKQGYLQAVRPVGWKWGRLEQDPKRFLRIIIDENQFNPKWLEHEYDLDNYEITDKAFRFPLDKLLTRGEWDALRSIPYNDKEVRPAIIKSIDRIALLEEKVNWDKRPDELKLHGSGGDFEVAESGGDYTSLKTAVETEAADLTSDAIAYFEVTGTWSGADDGDWDIDGYTPSETYYVSIEVVGDATHNDGVYNSTGHRIDNGSQCFDIEESYTRVSGLQKIGDGAIMFSDQYEDTIITKCYFHTPTGGGDLQVYNEDYDVYISNNVFWKEYSEAAGNEAIRFSAYTGTGHVYYNTFCGYIRAVEINSTATVILKNNAIFNNWDDIDDDASSTITFNATDDGDGTDGVDFTSEATDWNNVFTNYATGDLSLKDYTGDRSIIGQGDPISGYTTDILGNARDESTPDMGAFEFQGGGPAQTPYTAAGGATPAGALTRELAMLRTMVGEL